MMSKKIQSIINKQINNEFYSGYLYLSMEAYFKSMNLLGFANWMRVQAQEEQAHAIIMFNYLVDRGARVLLEPIKGPETDWKSPLAAFEAALAHEQGVTANINNIVSMARAENDHATDNAYQWFVKEQVEEEASADAIIQQLKLVKDNPAGLFMVDKDLAARTFVMPAPLVKPAP